ncbi:MAG: Ig domain-containing protein [Clostridia bacterium]|nr:Ig domain-containing protein [Clostridia bacterium]
MKKTLSLIMALVMALSVCSVMAFAADSSESLIGSKFTLETGSDKSTATAFAFGETVYGKVAAGKQSCYMLSVEEAKDVTFSFKASENIDVTIEKTDSTGKTVLTGDKVYDQKLSLSAAKYYITVSNPASIDQDIGTLSLMSEINDTPAEFYFSATCDNMPDLYVNINKKEAELTTGESVQLELSDCTVENLNHYWRIYDDPTTKIDENEVASVTSDGLVTIKMTNPSFTTDTTIKVQAVIYYCNEELTKSCTVKAIPANIFLEPYFDTSEDHSLRLGVGAYRGVIATTNYEDGKLVWESENTEVATVSSSGKITATGIGRTTVLVKLCDENDTPVFSRKITVIVSDNYVSVMGITLDAHTASFRANESIALTYTFETIPDNGKAPTNSKVTFTSSNPEIATVDVDGNVTGVAEGTATITVTTEDGSYTDECTVTVTPGIPNWLMVIIAPLRALYNLILMILGK